MVDNYSKLYKDCFYTSSCFTTRVLKTCFYLDFTHDVLLLMFDGNVSIFIRAIHYNDV